MRLVDGAVTLFNGGAVDLRTAALLPLEDFRRDVLGAVGAGSRIAAFFGRPRDGVTTLHAVLADDARGALATFATEVRDRFPSLTPDCPQAHLFEREIHEQHGIVPEGHPWLKPVRRHDAPYPFFVVEGDEIHEVGVGPVHAGIIDPGHFRLQCHGETVMNLEIHLGYQHRGVEQALAGGPDKRTMLLAECLSGDTTIGHALACAEAIEALAGCAAPPRAQAIRAAALELERLANHVGDLGALGTDIGFLPTSAWFGRLRGEFLNMTMELSGNRYGRGLVRPGGVRFDLPPAMAEEFARRLARAGREIHDVADEFFESPSVRSRLEGTGPLSLETCDQLGLLGPVARACGATRDVRRDHPAGAWRMRPMALAAAKTGDVLGRAQVRRLEIDASLEFLPGLLASLPDGDLLAPCGRTAPHRLAVSLVEGWRGEIVHAVVTGGDGRIERYKVKDPSFQNWTGLALALRGVPISDFPLCNKSFNLSYAGHDL
jgi:Ni,Fe-hydrogenase III large subunit